MFPARGAGRRHRRVPRCPGGWTGGDGPAPSPAPSATPTDHPATRSCSPGGPSFPLKPPKPFTSFIDAPAAPPMPNLSPAVRGTSSDKSDHISLEGQPPEPPWRPSLSSGCQPPCCSPGRGPPRLRRPLPSPVWTPRALSPGAAPPEQLHLGASVPLTQPSRPQSSGPGCDHVVLYVKGSDRPPGPVS